MTNSEPRPFRVIVSGTRHATITHRRIIRAVLQIEVEDQPQDMHRGHTLIHGDAPGVDRLAADIARAWEWEIEPHPAAWTQHTPDCPITDRHRRANCLLAGPRRNAAMLAASADLVIAFPAIGSAGRGGTWDLIHRATDANVYTIIQPLAITKTEEFPL